MPQYDIEIRNNNVASDLPDCVIVLDFAKASADCQAWLYANAKSDGTDIRVYLSDGVTQLNHDLISFSKPGTDEVAGYMRIRIPNVDSSANTPLRLDCDGSRSDGSTTATYPSAWRGYWTLDQDPSGSAPQMLDRTANGRHGTTSGSMSSGQSVSSVLGNGLDFDGSNDAVNFGTSGFDFGTGDFCLSLSVKVDAVTSGSSAAQNLLIKAQTSGAFAGFAFRIHARVSTSQIPKFELQPYNSSGNPITGSTTVVAGTQYRVCAGRVSGQLYLFVNGSSDAASVSNAVSVTSSEPLLMSSLVSGWTGPGLINGVIDDVIVSSAGPTAAGAAFEYANLSSADNEIDYIGEVVVASSRLLIRRRRMSA